jgi:hypothetical protein
LLVSAYSKVVEAFLTTTSGQISVTTTATRNQKSKKYTKQGTKNESNGFSVNDAIGTSTEITAIATSPKVITTSI